MGHRSPDLKRVAIDPELVRALQTLEIPISDTRHRGRLLGMTIACAMLNVGLYFILYVVTPIVAGAVIGYLLGHRTHSVTGATVGSFVAYLALFYYVAEATSLTASPIDIIAGSLFMALIGLVGGLLGLRLRGVRLHG